MERIVNVAGAQLGPIARNESRQHVVSRLIELMRDAKSRSSDIVVFPELALTTFFPRWWMEDEAEIDSFFETEMPSPATRPLFETAKQLQIGFYLGYAELERKNGAAHHYNTSILVDKNGTHHRQVSESAFARPRGQPAELSVPASGETLFRTR